MAKRPRNVLVLWTDQQRPDSIGAYGNRIVQTPNLDRLAETGALFEQTYCTQPVCTPSRASVQTGLYPHSHGAIGNNGRIHAHVPTLAQVLGPSGYACGYVGKWHLGDERLPQAGYERFWVSTEDGDVDHRPKGERNTSYFEYLLGRGITPRPDGRGGHIFPRSQAARLPEELGKPAFQASACLSFLETYRDQPFLLMCNFLEPHSPNFGPFDDMYDPADVTLPPSWYGEIEETVPLRYRRQREAYADSARWGRIAYEPVDTSTELPWKQAIARYWGLCTLVDKHVGRILTRLEELGLADDTIVVYTSDHGNMLGEHRLQGKQMPYEGAARVPLMIRVPGLAPRRIATPVSLVDLAPTLLDRLEQPVPSHMQGTPLIPLLSRGDTDPDEAEVVFEWHGHDGLPKPPAETDSSVDPDVARRLRLSEVRTIRRGRWKLNVHLSGEHELYDLHNDPGEQHNAFFDSGTELVTRDLFARLQAWQRRTDDGLLLPDPTERGAPPAEPAT